METLIIIIGVVLNILGVIGCIAPALPGPPLNYITLLLIHYSGYPFSNKFLFIWLGITILITALDYILPLMGAKFYGVSNKGIWGSFIGMVIGIIFFPPFGMILGLLIGAIIGELIAGKQDSEALRSGMVTFLLSMFMIIAKLAVSGIMMFYFVRQVW